jgi:hypothetical protein
MSILGKSIPKNLCDVMKLMVAFFIDKKVYGELFEDTSGDNFRTSSKRYHSSDSRRGGSARS